MGVVVKQTLYNTQLIKLKHADDYELWPEILEFREFPSFYKEIDAGFVPLDYQSIDPDSGLHYAAYKNNVFLVKEYIRLGATNLGDPFHVAYIQNSFDAYIILAKRLYTRKLRNRMLFCAFKRVMYHQFGSCPMALKIAKNISRKWLIKRIKRLDYDYDIKSLLEIANAAHRV